MARLLAGISLIAAIGCASTATFDRPWIEVSSANFSLFTTLDEREGRALLSDLELLRAALLLVTKLPDTPHPLPTEIYAFPSATEFTPNNRPAGGFFLPGLRVNVGALAPRNREARWSVFHEYTHFFLRAADPTLQPFWFEEGLAELFSVREADDGMVRIGIFPRSRLQALRDAHRRPDPAVRNFTLSDSLLPYSEVIRAPHVHDRAPYERWLFNAQSLLLVHHLVLERLIRGEEYVSALRRNVALLAQQMDDEDAFHEAFGVEVRDLSARMRKLLRKPTSFEIPRDQLAPALEPRVRSVPSGEIATRLGWLAVYAGKPQLAERFFSRASAADPTDSRALAGLGDCKKFQDRWQEAEPWYRRAIALDPGNWENHLELAEYYADLARREESRRDEWLARARQHFQRAIEIAPEQPEPHAMLGATYAIGEDQPPGPGIAALERALALLRSHPDIEHPLARLHQRAGNLARAAELSRRAVRSREDEAVELFEELERHQNAQRQ